MLSPGGSFLLFGSFDLVESGIGPQHFRNDDGAVFLLISFQNADQHTVGCGGGTDGMDETTLITVFVPDIEPAALEFGQIGVAGNFAVSAETGEESFDIILLVSGGAEITDAYIYHMIGQSESLEEGFFVFQTEFMIFGGFFGFAENDLLNFVELMHPEDTF